MCNLSFLKSQGNSESDVLPVNIKKRPMGRSPKSELFDGEHKKWNSVEGTWIEPDNFNET